MGMLSTRNRKLATYSVMFVLPGRVLASINNMQTVGKQAANSYRRASPKPAPAPMVTTAAAAAGPKEYVSICVCVHVIATLTMSDTHTQY